MKDVRRIQPEFAETPYGIVKRLRVIEDWLQAKADGGPLKVLDFGCGTGDQVTFPLAQAGHRVLGMDIHEPSIAAARRRYPLANLEFATVPAGQTLRFDEGFDAIICSEVIEHLKDPSRLLTAFKDMLKPDGRLIITTPNGRGPYELLCSLERLLKRLGVHSIFRGLVPAERLQTQSEAGFLNWQSQHVQFFKQGDLERMFLQSGFEVIARRPRTLLCGPYVDLFFKAAPFRESFIRWNASLSDALPMWCAADWMFLLKKIG